MELREGHILPNIRIQKIVMDNFKSVRHGEVVFNCGRKIVPQDTESDILGIYGQNGSGKTSVIEALAILERAMRGDLISVKYSECVSEWAEYAELSFTFDLQYPAKVPFTRTVVYSFKIKAVPNEKYDELEETSSIFSLFPKKVVIYDETIHASGLFDGKKKKKQVILSTSGGNYPIGPVRKISQYVGKNKEEAFIDLAVNQKSAAKESMSFIFMDETLELFYKYSDYSEYFQVLMELSNFAAFYLYAVDTRTSGIGATFAIPFNTRFGIFTLNLMTSTGMCQGIFEDLEFFVSTVNVVLPSLVTDLRLELVHNEIFRDGNKGQEVKVYTRRKDVLLPLRDESAGIIKLVSVLSLIIAAFNDRSITVAIDELDAGIYEYLLGEILTGLETYGKGQFIFTSHNLRPLEVLKKESLIFTTSNPDNRYIRLKGVGHTNNLRSLYLREIIGNTQDEQIYDAAKRQRMIAAFMKAGVGIAEEE